MYNYEIDINTNKEYTKLNNELIHRAAVIFLLMLLILLQACGAETKVSGVYETADLTQYPGFEHRDNTVIYEMEIKDVCREMEEGSTFAVLFSHAECPYCKASMPVIYDFLEHNGLRIGYVNCRKDPAWRSNLLMDDYGILVEHLGEYFPMDDLERKHLYVPHVFFIKEGKTVYEYSGVSPAFKGTGDLEERDIKFLTGRYETGFRMLENN